MPDDPTQNPAPEAATPSEEAPPKPGMPPRGKAEWSYKRTFGINEEMKKVINLTISATQAEVTALRRKLEKLTYGS